MKKLYKVIELLESIEVARPITDLTEAAWIRRLKSGKPDCVHLDYLDKPDAPYFYANLTLAGKQYLRELRGENDLSGVHQEIPKPRLIYSSYGRTRLLRRGDHTKIGYL